MSDHTLAVRGLTRRFGGLTAVDDVSFEVSAGDVFGIIGPNGAGKTTCFNLIAGDDQPTSGDIYLRGNKVTSSPAWARSRSGLARTFQIPQPLGDLTVRENVLIGALEHQSFKAAKRRADALVERLGLAAYAQTPANRLNTPTGKRLELARALATSPQILLLDEPVGGLNESEVAEAVDLLRAVSEDGATIIIIEHVLAAVFAICRQVLVLNYGSAIASGTPDVIRNDLRVIEAYLGKDDD